MNILQNLLYILLGLLIFEVCITAHEFGHYFAGRRLGLKVLEFSIGMGPKFWSREKNGILYSLRAFPIGGYCAFAGEDDGDESGDSINLQPAWKRLLMTLSGPFMNFILAVLLAVVILAALGEMRLSNRITVVSESSPAALAGIEVGDRVLGVNGERGDAEFILNSLPSGSGEQVSLTLERGGREFELAVQKQEVEPGVYRMGVSFGYERLRLPFFAAVGNSLKLCGLMLSEMVGLLGGLFTRGEGLNEVAGPVGIIGTITTVAQESFAQSFLSGLDALLRLALLISLNLGLMNLLPLPALDGGRAVLQTIEMITGKHLPRRFEGVLNMVALFALLGLMLLISGRDILRLFGVIS
ncbi:MAG: M50 family metallopeptidase [Christensenellaceae bacterium]|jgi:regulator of sigma E protease|nr:M50 family metallopeptidase [Christensenellaceae bacterium]